MTVLCFMLLVICILESFALFYLLNKIDNNVLNVLGILKNLANPDGGILKNLADLDGSISKSFTDLDGRISKEADELKSRMAQGFSDERSDESVKGSVNESAKSGINKSIKGSVNESAKGNGNECVNDRVDGNAAPAPGNHIKDAATPSDGQILNQGEETASQNPDKPLTVQTDRNPTTEKSNQKRRFYINNVDDILHWRSPARLVESQEGSYLEIDSVEEVVYIRPTFAIVNEMNFVYESVNCLFETNQDVKSAKSYRIKEVRRNAAILDMGEGVYSVKEKGLLII